MYHGQPYPQGRDIGFILDCRPIRLFLADRKIALVSFIVVLFTHANHQ